MAFQCVVVTPDQQVFDRKVSAVVFPAHDGQVGILTDRAPILVKLGLGELKLTPANQAASQSFYIEGGIAQMKDNLLTILTEKAVPSADINPETARAELAEATARIATDAKTRAARDRALARSRAMDAMAARR